MSSRAEMSAQLRHDARTTLEQFEAAATISRQLERHEAYVQHLQACLQQHQYLFVLDGALGWLRHQLGHRKEVARGIAARLAPAALTACNQVGSSQGTVQKVLDQLQQRLSNWLRRGSAEHFDRAVHEIWFLIDLMRLSLKLGDVFAAIQNRHELRKHLMKHPRPGAVADVNEAEREFEELVQRLKHDARAFVPRLGVLARPGMYTIGAAFALRGLRSIWCASPKRDASADGSARIGSGSGLLLIAFGAAAVAGAEMLDRHIFPN